MTNRLQMLRDRLKQDSTKSNNNKRGDYYNFWDMEVGKSVKLRLLPDANLENPYIFYVEKMTHKINISGKDETVVCPSTFNEKCPICDLSRQFYKAEGRDSKKGKQYYRDKSALVRAVILEDPLPENEDGEKYTNKVVTLQINNKLLKHINTLIADPEVVGDDEEPWGTGEGLDLVIKKTMDGKWASYITGTSFSRKPTKLPVDIADEIQLIDLTTLLPKKPDLEMIEKKLEAHLSGDDEEEGDDEEGDDEDVKRLLAKKSSSVPSSTPASKSKQKAPEPEEDEEEEEEEATPEPPRRQAKPDPVAEDEDEDEIELRQLLERRRQKKG